MSLKEATTVILQYHPLGMVKATVQSMDQHSITVVTKPIRLAADTEVTIIFPLATHGKPNFHRISARVSRSHDGIAELSFAGESPEFPSIWASHTEISPPLY